MDGWGGYRHTMDGEVIGTLWMDGEVIGTLWMDGEVIGTLWMRRL